MKTSETITSVEAHLGSMSLEQKVGQMLCLGFCGSYPHPDILEAIEKEAAERSVLVLRDRDGLLPLANGAKVLVAEEVAMIQKRLNSERAYPGALYHSLLDAGCAAWGVDSGMGTIVVTFSPVAASMRAAARILTGDLQASAKLGFDPSKTY